jgi:hypothetical protein
LKNETANLLNYEMRRKMRQVAVQVQDVGSYLCWQTYVDDPGKGPWHCQALHIAKKSRHRKYSTSGIAAYLSRFFRKENRYGSIQFYDGTDADNEGEVYIHGGEHWTTQRWAEILKKYSVTFYRSLFAPSQITN